jgi:hypothetical protein
LNGLGLEPDLVNDVLGVYRSLPLKLLGVLRDQLLEARLNNLQVLQHGVAILFRHATDEFRGRIIKDRADRRKIQFVAVILQGLTPFRLSPLERTFQRKCVGSWNSGLNNCFIGFRSAEGAAFLRAIISGRGKRYA